MTAAEKWQLLQRHVQSHFVTPRLSHRDRPFRNKAPHTTLIKYDGSHRHPPKWYISLLSGGVRDDTKCRVPTDFVDTITRKVNEHEDGSIVSPDGLASMSFLRLPHPRTGPFLAHSPDHSLRPALSGSIPVLALPSRRARHRLVWKVGDSGGTERVPTKSTIVVLHRGRSHFR